MAVLNRNKWISVGILGLLVLLTVWKLFFKPGQQLCSFVPEHAAWYVETDHPGTILQEIEKSILPFSDSGITLLEDLKAGTEVFRKVFSPRSDLLNSISESTFGVSAHAISGNEAGYVFYSAIDGDGQLEIQGFLEKQFRGREGFRFEKREYLGESLIDITGKSGSTFSVAFLKNTIVASFSGFLVEEVVRNSGVFIKPGFAARLRNDSRFGHIQNKPMRLFLNTGNLSAYTRQFLGIKELDIASLTGEAMVLGLDGWSKLDIDCQGYSISREGSVSSGQVLDPDLKKLLPKGADVLVFQLALKDLWKSLPGRKVEEDGKSRMLEDALFDEALLGLSEGQGLKKYDHVLIAKVKDKGALEQFLQSISSPSSPSELYKENYRGSLILKHRNNSLASEAGGTFFRDWSAPFFTISAGHFIVSDQIEMVRRCVDAGLNKEESASQGADPASLFRFEAGVNRLIPFLMENSSGSLRKYFREWLPLFKSVNSLSISDFGETENPGISMKIRLRLPAVQSDSLFAIQRIFLDSTAFFPPVRLESDENSRMVWAIQDIKKQVHFVDENLQKKASLGLGDFWVCAPSVLKRKKGFSVLVPLPKGVKVFSADGSPEADFQVALADSLSTLCQASLIDYDLSLQYRLFAASRYGYVLAADQSGKLLSGWNPQKHPFPLAFPPRHIRIANHDYILMLDNRGNLMITNRKGEMQAGFPLKLKGDSFSGFFLEPGLEPENSFIYCLSELGQMEKLNFLGESVSFIQLFRPEISTRFVLCPDQAGRTFAVARVTGGAITIFDQSYRPIMDQRFSGKKFAIRHFQFGSSNKVFAITDLDSKSCALYNESGLSILKKPFPATQAVDILPAPGSEMKLRILSVFENRVSISEFTKD